MKKIHFISVFILISLLLVNGILVAQIKSNRVTDKQTTPNTISVGDFGAVPDDGINVHGQFFLVNSKSGQKQITLKGLHEKNIYKYSLPSESRVAFFDGAKIRHFGTIREASFDPETGLQSLQFIEALPDWISEGTECVPYALLPDAVTISNSIFRNISTCGIIIKSDNTMVKNCVFKDVERLAVFALCSFYDPSIRPCKIDYI